MARFRCFLTVRQIAKNGSKSLPHAVNKPVGGCETIGATLCLTIEIYYPHIQTRKICNNSSCNVVSKTALLPHVRLRLPSINHKTNLARSQRRFAQPPVAPPETSSRRALVVVVPEGLCAEVPEGLVLKCPKDFFLRCPKDFCGARRTLFWGARRA